METALITGASSGIGRELARSLFSLGKRVVVVGRGAQRLEALVAELRAAQPDRAQAAHVLVADLSTLAGVRQLAQAFKARFDRLDLLVNNAGGIFTTRHLTADGFEHTFALNHLAYFLLTHELLPLLRSTPDARIVSTASTAHRGGQIRLDDLNFEQRAWRWGWGAYNQSKLANILFTRSLAARLSPEEVSVSCFHPGVVGTGFLSTGNGVLARAAMGVGRPFLRTPAQGAATGLWAATEADPVQIHGAYLADARVARPSRRAQDDDVAEALWRRSAELCGVEAP